MNIISEYEQILIGNRPKFSSKNFRFDPGSNERIVLFVFKYAIEELLNWKPHEAEYLFTYAVVRSLKLQTLLHHIQFPCELTLRNTEYIVHLLYPRAVPYNFKKYVLATYERVMRNEIKYPKDYMFGNKGLIRAGLCMQYALKKHKLFHSTEEMYAFFASPDGKAFLKKYKLQQLYRRFYKTPIDYLHHSIPDTLRCEFYYCYYKFLYLYQRQHHCLPPM